MTQQLDLYKVDNGVYPAGDTQLATLNLKATKQAYANGFSGNVHNLLYCRVTATGPSQFALIGSSKSGNVYTYTSASGIISVSTSWASTSSVTNCQNAGINQTIGTDRDIFYYNSAWQPYIGG